MLTPRQYAATIDKPYWTVIDWLRNGLIPDAKCHNLASGRIWEIPEGTPEPKRAPVGRPKKATPTTTLKPKKRN